MALINTKKTALFLQAGQTLPTPPANFLETSTPVLIAPNFETGDVYRVNGQLNNRDTYVDLCRTKVDFTVEHDMRGASEKSGAFDTPPQYSELLKSAGFDEVIDATVGVETVIYNNNVNAVLPASAIAYVDGNKFSMSGSLANALTMDFSVGQTAKISAQMTGYIDSPIPEVEANPDVTLTEEGLLIVSCIDVVTFGGTCLPSESVKITNNPEIQDIYTMGGACGIKNNFTSDYALQVEVTYRVDSAGYDEEATNISTETPKELIIKMGLDSAGAEVNGKSVLITVPLAKTTVYADTTDKDTLLRTTTYRAMNNVAHAMSIKHGFYA